MDLALMDRIETVEWSSVKRAADLGCGSGRTARWMRTQADFPIDGVDVTPAMLDLAHAQGNHDRLVVADVRATGLDANAYDLVTCVLVDEHLAGLGPLYAEARRLLRYGPGGTFVIVGVHPYFLMAVGMPTHFETPGGEPVAIETHLHLTSAHVAAACAAGLTAREMHEALVDDQLIRLKPELGSPIAACPSATPWSSRPPDRPRSAPPPVPAHAAPRSPDPAWNPGTHPPYHGGEGHGPRCSPPCRCRSRRPLPRPCRGRPVPRPGRGRGRRGSQRRRQDQPAARLRRAHAGDLGRRPRSSASTSPRTTRRCGVSSASWGMPPRSTTTSARRRTSGSPCAPWAFPPPAPTTRSSGSASPAACAPRLPGASPPASVVASPWPRSWRAAPRSGCSTSRTPGSMRAAGPSSASSSPRPWRTAPPCCSPRTSRSSRSPWPTAS